MGSLYANRGRVGLVCAMIGTTLQVGFIVGLPKIIPALRDLSSALGVSGIGDPAGLVGALGEVFVGSALALGLGGFGLVLLCVALIGARYRARWFRWFLAGESVLLLFMVPIGTLFGIFFLGYLRAHWQEFSVASVRVGA